MTRPPEASQNAPGRADRPAGTTIAGSAETRARVLAALQAHDWRNDGLDRAPTATEWSPHPNHEHDSDHDGKCQRCYTYAKRELALSMLGNAGPYKSYDHKAERQKRIANENRLASAFEGFGV